MHFLDENALFFSIQGFEKSIYKIEEIRKTHLFSKIAVADSNWEYMYSGFLSVGHCIGTVSRVLQKTRCIVEWDVS